MRRKVDELSPGDKFTCAQGAFWVYVRRDGASHGVHHVRTKDGFDTLMAGCATVTDGWVEGAGWLRPMVTLSTC
jgi:hypothetical protein